MRFAVYGEKTQQLSEHECFEINSNHVQGLLRFDKVQKKKYFKLYYDITGFVSLRKYLKSPMDRRKFRKLLNGILTVLINVKDANFNQQKLLFDFRSVMINPATDGVFFIYLPFQPFEAETTLKEFLLGVVDRATFTSEEDTSYVQDYIKILNEGVNFSLFELEEYVNRIGVNPAAARMGTVICPNCGAETESDEMYCSKCGYKISKGNPHTGGTYTYPGKGKKPAAADPPVDVFKPEATVNEKPLQSGKTGGTVILGTGDLDKTAKGVLIRNSNGVNYKILKAKTVIGSDPSCDIMIDGNKYVSHFHAVITADGNRFYIRDNSSTNHTYVDGLRIENSDIEIFSGTAVKLANENFVFNVN